MRIPELPEFVRRRVLDPHVPGEAVGGRPPSLGRPEAPPASREAFGRDLPDFLPEGEDLRFAFQPRGTPPQEIHVFTLTLNDLLEGAGLPAAKDAGWRFLTQVPAGPAVAGDVVEVGPEKRPRMTSLANDPLIRDLIDAIHALEKVAWHQAADQFELRMLRIPGMNFEAFWLSVDGQNDLLVPFLTRTRGIETMRLYQASQLLEMLKPKAARFLAFNDTGE